MNGIKILSLSSPPPKSWFCQVDSICSKYSLPSALHILLNPLPKYTFKKMSKAAVINWWEQKMRYESSQLKSLVYFKPHFYRLSRPHLIWSMAGNNPYEIVKANTQCNMLGSRYRCEKLRRHWTQNTSGFCELEPCWSNSVEGSLEHMLWDCVGLSVCRQNLFTLWHNTLDEYSQIKHILGPS